MGSNISGNVSVSKVHLYSFSSVRFLAFFCVCFGNLFLCSEFLGCVVYNYFFKKRMSV